ncbi:hypothetical protein OH76DRAFT_1362279 [Lentinus brumalis]|uniref:CxC2-like cysteine cluster KDZ transposase-associated domain-containing protein n=1 Tax=Lentinus brumalis TaxID=2498619 RepID=A0A371CR02_9APHY|nr:hypothetical protein OH76DRAFT_1362279 [Polyporus brumalis]
MSSSSRSNKKAKKGRQQGGFYEAPTHASQILSLSADGRRLRVLNELLREQVVRPEEQHDPEAGAVPGAGDGAPDTLNLPPVGAEAVDGAEGMAVVAKTRAKRYPASDEPLRAWIPYREQYLDEVLRLEGRAWARTTSQCPRCGKAAPSYRCAECTGGDIFCQECVVQIHAHLPLHRIQRWDGTFFNNVTLRDLGLFVRPAHLDGSSCLTCRPGLEGLTPITIIHANGLHVVNLQFCSCVEEERRTLFLRLSWWPATATDPRTCATFFVLKQFHLLNLQGKLTIYDFYKSLELATDNTGLQKIPVSAMTLMVRQWRHVMLAKRAGRGHDSGGIESTTQGGLALKCRACPRPGVNLPADWENARAEDAWLYQLMISQDANFRLKNRLRTGSHEDPWLGPGLAYCVDDVPYGEYVMSLATQEDIRTCSGFAALLNALTRSSKGLRATGLIAVSCRHELFLGKGVGDLQKGERWANIDYLVASAVKGTGVRKIMDSYDVGCEHEKGFFERAVEFPDHIKLDLPKDGWVFVVPKFHVSAHKPECQGAFSPNYVPFSARFDGEHVERLWSMLNPAAPSTKEMGPGARKETLDDLCSFNNWRKTVNLGEQLLKLLVEAIPEAANHKKDFEAFDSKLCRQRPEEVQRWMEMVRVWEQDRRNSPSPFTIVHKAVTRAEVRLRLLAEENHLSANSTASDLEAGPSGFIVLGLEILAAQRNLALQRKEADDSDSALLRIKVQKRLAILLGKVRKFRQLGATYMPAVHASSTSATPPKALTALDVESFAVTLPSDLPSEQREQVCGEKLPRIEDELQYADACDALEDLRHSLRMRTCYNQDKIANVTGQVPNTKARSLQSSVDQAVKNAADRYRRARQAIEHLRGPGAWQDVLRPLLNTDLRQGQASLTRPVSDELAEGLIAYADEHALMETAIAATFEAKWAVVQEKAYAYLNNVPPAGGQDAQAQSQRIEIVQVEIEVASEVENSSDDEGR